MDDAERRHRVVVVLRGLERSVVELFETAVDRLQECDGRPRGFDAVLAERELVQLPNAIPPILAKHVEELEELDRMDRTGDQVVVPTPKVVVDVHAKQASVVDSQLCRVGWRLSAIERVAEVEEYSDVGESDLFNREQCPRH